MRLVDTPLPGVKIVEPQIFGDDRGFFTEVWHAEKFAAQGLEPMFVQDNHSRSSKNILRGLHYQLGEPQGKLVRCTAGAIFDVAVDLRRSSASFKQWFGIILDGSSMQQLWVPEGFGHGFLALSETADVQYKCTAPYDADQDRSLAWNDPALANECPLDGAAPLVSYKDAGAPRLSEPEISP